MIPLTKKGFSDVKRAIEGSIALWKRDDIGSDEWRRTAGAARAAAEAAKYDYFADKLIKLLKELSNEVLGE